MSYDDVNDLLSKLNCEVLWDDFAYEVRWAVAGDSIVLQLVARLENNEYMSFGLSGDKSRSRMVGGDVVVAWVDKESLKGYAKDYYLDAKSQCSGGRGSCPDENIEAGADSVRLLNAALVNGYSIVTFQRSLKAQDDLDKDVLTNSSQPIIWAVGPLNSRKEVSYHSLANRGDILIDFGRAPKWNCPTPESISGQEESEGPSGVGEREEARIQEARIQDSNRREPLPKVQIPTPAPAPKSLAWDIPAIKCYEPEDGVFYAQMGPTGGKHGYSAITGHVGWGISWYINGLLIPEINVVRGRTYTFIVEGGLDPETPARYHPFYITDDPVGGYQYKTPQERANIQIFAGAVQNKRGEVRPTGVGRLCNWTPDPNAPPADEFSSFGAYQRTLRLECDPGNPGIIQWTVEKDTPDTVYYQCYTHRYLGWKINVHDHCEGAAASSPVQSVVKAPSSILKYYESDPEGSESINYETRVKPDAEVLKNLLEKNQSHSKFNELVNIEATNKFQQQVFGEKKPVPQNLIHAIQHHEIVVELPQEAHKVSQPSIGQKKQFAAPLLESSGYSVTEESLEGIQQNFQIIPLSFPRPGQLVLGPQNHPFKREEPFRLMEQMKDGNKFQEEALRLQIDEKTKRKNHKSPYQNKVASRLPGGPGRFRKPLPSNGLAFQQRPVPAGSFRPHPPAPKSQKRPPTMSAYKAGQNFQPKSPQSHHRVNVALGPDDSRRQDAQLIRQIKRPNKNQQSLAPGLHDLLGSPSVHKASAPNVVFAQSSGFDPLSVQVEGGFKPILNSGASLKSSADLSERADLEVEENPDDGIGVIDLVSVKKHGEEGFPVKEIREVEKSAIEGERNNEKEVDLFKNQKPQTFEPIFIPSRPDDGLRRNPEKYKKKPTLSLKPRYDQPKVHLPQKGEEISVKIRPSVSVVRTSLYSDDVVPPFRIKLQEKTPQLRFHQSGATESLSAEGNETGGGLSGEPRAENIQEVLEMFEPKSDETHAKETVASPEGKSKGEESSQDEMAVADERKEFYLPPKAEFRSYDGKVVKAVEAPILPEANPPTDLSKLPQFVPFKGVIPPLARAVDADSLPQLRNSKLARQDILPPPSPAAEGIASKHSTNFPTLKVPNRKKRSPDHVPGHEGPDHHHHHHHNSSSANASNLFYVTFVALSLKYLQM